MEFRGNRDGRNGRGEFRPRREGEGRGRRDDNRGGRSEGYRSYGREGRRPERSSGYGDRNRYPNPNSSSGDRGGYSSRGDQDGRREWREDNRNYRSDGPPRRYAQDSGYSNRGSGGYRANSNFNRSWGGPRSSDRGRYRDSYRNDNRNSNSNSEQTSWQTVAKWYDGSVGYKGHYYHEKIVIPNALNLLELGAESSLLDLACGQGVFPRNCPALQGYLGVDLSEELVKEAEAKNKYKHYQFKHADVGQPLQEVEDGGFSHAIIMLALQNIASPEGVVQNASRALQDGGRFLIVLNHPYFRIPQNTGWIVDRANELQYRGVKKYMSALRVQVDMTPGEVEAEKKQFTYSFHRSLATYSKILRQNGFVIEQIDEWCSDKVSEGRHAEMENDARKEFPLFMGILARKL